MMMSGPHMRTAWTVMASACAAAFFATLAATHASPSVFDIVFGVLPFFALGSALVLTACRLLGVAREDAETGLMRLLFAAAGISIIAALMGAWDNIGAILLPHEALFSVLTLGLWPSGAGPLAVIRFLPAVLALGVFLIARRAHVAETRAVLAAVAVYLAQSFFVHALSWVVWAECLRAHDILENAQDAYRIFITSNVNGYWTNSQAERFFASVGGQAENGMQALHGAIAYAGALLLALADWAPWSRGLTALRDALQRPSVLRRAGLLLFGAAVGFSVRMDAFSFSDIVACLLFLAAAIGWLAAWEGEDAGVEGMGQGLVLALGSVLFLGWPVALGFVIADLMRRVLIRGQAWQGIWTTAAGHLFAAFALAWAGLAFGLRDLPISGWMLHAVVAVSVLAAAAWLGTKLLRSALAPRWQVAYLLGAAGFSVLISAQFLFCIPAVLLFVAIPILRRSEPRWEAVKVRLLDAFLGALALVTLFAPGLLTH